ncbi:MAG TPA: hypothetical protein VJU77_10640 [Chthoniobacterales bacterium]|nr:hypothetical protein [Chthoniobacterales bacterium]
MKSVLCLAAIALFLINRPSAIGSVDANGAAQDIDESPPPVVQDRSKETVAPPLEKKCEPPADTEFRIGLPGWMAGLSGDFGVRGTVADVDVDFVDILKRVDMIAAGSLYYRSHRWEFSADGLYLRLSDEAQLRGVLFGSAHLALKSAFAEGFVGYRMINCQQGYLSHFAGFRYNYMSGDFRLTGALAAGRRTFGEIDWVDPVVGLGGRVHLWKPISLWARADFGGFGTVSDFTWQVQGGLELQITRSIYSNIGWRHLKNDYTSGGFTDKTAMSGPYIETGINF